MRTHPAGVIQDEYEDHDEEAPDQRLDEVADLSRIRGEYEDHWRLVHAEWLAAQERRREERRAQARRRVYGLVQRHATKLARKDTP